MASTTARKTTEPEPLEDITPAINAIIKQGALPQPPTAEEATAAGLRALRDALGNLAAGLGYRRGTLNSTLMALGASPDDVETMRQFLHAHPAPETSS
jgi:hypothetical protein